MKDPIAEAFDILKTSHGKSLDADKKRSFIVRSQSSMRIRPTGTAKFEKTINVEREIHKVLYGKMDDIGKFLKREIRSRIVTENIPPPLSPITVQRKGHDHALIETSEMLKAIDYKVGTDGEHVICEVGIFDEQIAKRATVHEFGSGRVPRRAFLRPVYDAHVDEIDDMLKDAAYQKIVAIWTS